MTLRIQQNDTITVSPVTFNENGKPIRVNATWKRRYQLSAAEIDAMDVAEAKRRLADPNEKRVSWDALKAELGI